MGEIPSTTDNTSEIEESEASLCHTFGLFQFTVDNNAVLKCENRVSDIIGSAPCDSEKESSEGMLVQRRFPDSSRPFE